MELKNLVIAALVVLVVVFGFLAFRPAIELPLGAIPGSTLPDCVDQNGSEICKARIAMNAASSTVCSIRAPGHGSSTLTSFTANISTATSSVAVMVLQSATSSSGGFAPSQGTATSSRVIISSTTNYVASSRNLFQYNATSTPGLFQANELAANEYVVFSLRSGTIADTDSTATISGACNATFQITR